MYHAKERRTGQIISASKASPYGDYRCPTCRAEVFLRSGKYRADHFAHMPGQGKLECEDFHPSDDLRQRWSYPPFEPSGPAIDPLKISIELEHGHDARRGARKWLLKLTLPKSNDEHGEIRVDLGGGDRRKVAMSNLALGSRTYSADPDAPDFGVIWTSADLRKEYRAAVEHRIPGLRQKSATAFAANRHKLKPLCRALHWGESYYFIFKSDFELGFPQCIPRLALAENQGWSCSLVVLPDEPDSEIATWLEDVCDMQIIRSKREWALVYPPSYGFNDDGALNLSSTANVLLAVKPNQADDHAEAELTCLAGNETASTNLREPKRALLEVNFREQSPHPIFLTWDNSELATLIAKPYPETVVDPSVIFEFQDGANKTQALLHTRQCRRLLSEVRSRGLKIFAISAAPGVSGLMHKRDGRASSLSVKSLEFSNANGSLRASLPAPQVEEINAALKNWQHEVHLDFGAFGEFTAWPIPERHSSSAAPRIEKELRNRIEWLSKASGSYVNSERVVLSALSDSALVRHLENLKVPAALIVHRRAIESELQSKSGRTR